VTAAGWLLVGILLGVLLAVLLIEWHDGHQRRQRRHRTRASDVRQDPGTEFSGP
jgi:hypothetical protein